MDFTNKRHAIAFVRFVDGGEIQETFYCCNKLHKAEVKICLMFCFHTWKKIMFSDLGEITLASVLVMPINSWLLGGFFFLSLMHWSFFFLFRSSEDEINGILVDATEVISFLSDDHITWKYFKNCKNLGKEHIKFLLHAESWYLTKKDFSIQCLN